MNIQLLQWGLLAFMFGLVLALPLAAVHYNQAGPFAGLVTNVRKLRSAHIDFFMQATAAGFVYLLEAATKTQFPVYVVIPLCYGMIGNPLILLLEATPLHQSGFSSLFYKLLRATSPLCLLVAWSVIAVLLLPWMLKLLLIGFVGLGVFVVILKKRSVDDASQTEVDNRRSAV